VGCRRPHPVRAVDGRPGVGRAAGDRGLFHDRQGLDEQAFLVFTDSVLKRRPYIDTLLWAPLLTSLGEAGSGRASGSAALPARATTDGRLARSGELRVPVLFSASHNGFGVAPGVDLNATSELAALFLRARESGKVAVSGRMDIARAGQNQAAVRVIYAALPVYAPDDARRARGSGRRVEPLGFVIGVYDIEQLVDVAISLLEPRGVEVLVRDDSAGGDAQFLHFYASRLSHARRYGPLVCCRRGRGSAADDDPDSRRRPQWTITCVATHTFRSAEAFTKAHWSVLLGGIPVYRPAELLPGAQSPGTGQSNCPDADHLRARGTLSPVGRNGRCRLLGDQRRRDAARVHRPCVPADRRAPR
jgi:hypothetical protein